MICFAQEFEERKYEDLPKINWKEDYNDAKFVANYFFTAGGSLGDRYNYEIIVTDSIITLIFNSPDFSSFNYLKYVKRFELEQEELDTLKEVIKNATLKQTHTGIAHWEGSMYTREVLIIKADNIFIAGGQTYMPTYAYADDEPEDKVKKEVEEDRKTSSSISGNYDGIINLLKKHFTNIDELYKQALR